MATRRAGGSKARRKAENVGRFIAEVLVASQAFDHGESVWRSFQELGELLVGECQPCSPCALQTNLPRGGLGLVSGSSQHRRWRQFGRLSTSLELRMLAMPVGRLLICMPDAQQRGLIEGPPQNLHTER